MNGTARPFCDRVLEALSLSFAAIFVAWLLGSLLAPAIAAFAGAFGESGQVHWDGLGRLALVFGFYSGIVLVAFALVLVWPACLVALRWAPVHWLHAAAVGAVIGSIPGIWATRAATVAVLITAAYGAVIGIVAARLQQRWNRPTKRL